jgi:hypothetical protein
MLGSKHIISILPLIVLLMGVCVLGAFAQGADSRTPGQRDDPDQPMGLRESQQKMRIEQEKKEYDEMVDRGQQALKLSEDLERSFSQTPTITRADLEKLEGMEKLVKKIRSSLGGGSSDDDDDTSEDASPKTPADAVKALQSITGRLVDELKKSSRFGVSVVAIQSTNSVLKIVRFLRGSK